MQISVMLVLIFGHTYKSNAHFALSHGTYGLVEILLNAQRQQCVSIHTFISALQSSRNKYIYMDIYIYIYIYYIIHTFHNMLLFFKYMLFNGIIGETHK